MQASATTKSPENSAAKRAQTLLGSVTNAEDSPALAWNKAFKGQKFPPRVLAIVFTYLREENRHDDVVEGLQAAIRNDHAQPWMYDVLAIEMKLAKRPQKEIDRVLLSRIDFAPGNQAQMLVTATNLAGFGAYDRAMEICREAAKRTPFQGTVWSTAREIADRSKDPEAILWSRTGTIKHVWKEDYETLHKLCLLELDDLERRLKSSGKLQLASSVREAKAKSVQRDIRISIHWSGDADIDLSVTEPGGRICSRKNRLTQNGGLLIKQSNGGKSSRGSHSEEYVCSIAPPGDYTVTVRHIHGRVIQGAVIIRQIRYENSTRELKTQVIEKGVVGNDLTVRVELNHGRGAVSASK